MVAHGRSAWGRCPSRRRPDPPSGRVLGSLAVSRNGGGRPPHRMGHGLLRKRHQCTSPMPVSPTSLWTTQRRPPCPASPSASRGSPPSPRPRRDQPPRPSASFSFRPMLLPMRLVTSNLWSAAVNMCGGGLFWCIVSPRHRGHWHMGLHHAES